MLVNYLITGLATFSTILSSILISKVAFAHLDQDSLQIWFLMAASLPFIGLLDLGATALIPSALAQHRANPDDLHGYIGSFLTIGGSILLLFCLLAWLIVIGYELIPGMKEYKAVLIVFLLGVALRIFANILQAILYSFDKNREEKIIRITSLLIMSTVCIFLLEKNFGLLSISISWLVSAAVSTVLTVVILYKQGAIKAELLKCKREYSVDIVKNSMHYLSFALPGMFVYSAVPFYIASTLEKRYSVEYGLIQQICNAMLVISAIFTTIYVPKLANSYREDMTEARKLLIKNSLLVCNKAGIIIIGVLLNIDLIIQLWTGKNIYIDKYFLIIYFLAIWFEIMQTTLASASLATGFNKFGLVTLMSGIIVSITMLPMINYFGFVGVAICIFISQLVTCHFFNIRKSLKIYNISFSFYLRSISKPAYLFLFFIFIVLICEISGYNNYIIYINIIFIPIAIYLLIDSYQIFRN